MSDIKNTIRVKLADCEVREKNLGITYNTETFDETIARMAGMEIFDGCYYEMGPLTPIVGEAINQAIAEMLGATDLRYPTIEVVEESYMVSDDNVIWFPDIKVTDTDNYKVAEHSNDDLGAILDHLDSDAVYSTAYDKLTDLVRWKVDHHELTITREARPGDKNRDARWLNLYDSPHIDELHMTAFTHYGWKWKGHCPGHNAAHELCQWAFDTRQDYEQFWADCGVPMRNGVADPYAPGAGNGNLNLNDNLNLNANPQTTDNRQQTTDNGQQKPAAEATASSAAQPPTPKDMEQPITLTAPAEVPTSYLTHDPEAEKACEGRFTDELAAIALYEQTAGATVRKAITRQGSKYYLYAEELDMLFMWDGTIIQSGSRKGKPSGARKALIFITDNDGKTTKYIFNQNHNAKEFLQGVCNGEDIAELLAKHAKAAGKKTTDNRQRTTDNGQQSSVNSQQSTDNVAGASAPSAPKTETPKTETPAPSAPKEETPDVTPTIGMKFYTLDEDGGRYAYLVRPEGTADRVFGINMSNPDMPVTFNNLCPRGAMDAGRAQRIDGDVPADIINAFVKAGVININAMTQATPATAKSNDDGANAPAADEEARKAEESKRRAAEEEAARKAEAEAAAAKKRAEEEARKAEESKRRAAEEEARKKAEAEAEAKRKAEAEAAAKKFAPKRHAMYEDIKIMLELQAEVFRAPYIYGPAGTGKTYLAKQVMEDMGLEVVMLNAIQDVLDVAGFIDGNGVYHGTPASDAVINGKGLIVDEFDRGLRQPISWLNALTANRIGTFPVRNEQTGVTEMRTVKAHPNFRLVACGNTLCTGADRMYNSAECLDAATMDRFNFIKVDYDSELELHLAKGDKELVEFINNFRAACSACRLDHLCSYRALEGIKGYEGRFSIEKAIDYCLTKGMTADNQRSIANNLEIYGKNRYAEAFKKMAANAKRNVA